MDEEQSIGGVEELLERALVRHQSTASILRAAGRDREARRLEVYAARLRLRLDQPAAARAMYEFLSGIRSATSLMALVEVGLDGAMSLMGAELGNVQLRDPATGALRIVCHCGFDREFLEYFAVVDDDGSACGRAASGASQIVIDDVDRDPAFAPHRDIAASSRFRAVQSTPLMDSQGRLVGVISTHFPGPHRPAPLELSLMRWFADVLSAAIPATRRPAKVDDPGVQAPRANDGIVYRHAEAAHIRSAEAAVAAGRGR